jgi:two-component system, OmpR family, sensor histidine kinase MprB
MIRSRRHRHAPLRAPSSLSLRWRVMLLAMSMVAMAVVLMAFAVYAVISAALYGDIDNQLQSRAQLLIASGSLAADPGKAIEGTAYSDVNAMLVNPGHTIYTANQPRRQSSAATCSWRVAPHPINGSSPSTCPTAVHC